MKVFFIDVDGVFNSCDDEYIYTMPAPHMYHPHIVDMNKIAMFNFVVEKLNEFEPVRIVVSSAWRTAFDSAEEFSLITGIALEYIHDDWRTCFIGRSSENVRHLEAEQWLRDHPEVEGWIAFDDLPFLYPAMNFIKTEGLLGLEMEHLQEACRRLGYVLDYHANMDNNDPNRWLRFRNGWRLAKLEDVPVA